MFFHTNVLSPTGSDRDQRTATESVWASRTEGALEGGIGMDLGGGGRKFQLVGSTVGGVAVRVVEGWSQGSAVGESCVSLTETKAGVVRMAPAPYLAGGGWVEMGYGDFSPRTLGW